MMTLSPSYLFIVCIIARLLLALLAKEHPMFVVPIAVAISIGFFLAYFAGTRRECPESGDETGPCWWNDVRPIHGLTYAIFVVMALMKNNDAWYILLLDVMIGIAVFGIHQKKISEKSDQRAI